MFLKIGHRGACGYEPENTLRSFRRALELKVDMIEFDVYTLAGGEIVIIHDDKVNRTTNGQGYVLDKSFEEIRKLDAGQGEKIPTLEETLDLIDKKCQVNIELKGVGTAESVWAVIEKYVTEKGWNYEDFFISSFNHHELKKFQELAPKVRIGVLIVGLPIDYAVLAEKLGAYSINVSQEFINKEFVADAHQRGLKIFAFTVNDVDDIKRMRDLGVDGIFSNYPERI